MSQRVKKPGKVDDNNGKRRRKRPSGSDGEGDGTQSGSNSGGNCPFPSLGGMWTPRHLNDLKVSSIYNRNSAEAPAELYRKDLISAMKLADSEPLTPEEYWLITDPWKQEWEKGVQVPVNPESLPEPEVVVISPVNERSHDFRLPKKKYIRVTHDDFFNPDYHQLVSTAARAEKVCSYDLDDIDASWISCANSDRGMQNLPIISEFLMEQVIEELELQCWEQVQTILKSQEGLGIEYDENVICDVCRSPESEEGNEMVFCDACNICVHQACYGITTIPSGSWLCRTCTLSMRPSCVLCPNMGGAMKATRSGQKWAHVACAIWIPEVSIGSVEKMEPITKISSIPQSRWSLICVLCKDKSGACIQCSVKTCKTAYHVTCAFKNGLEMKPIIVDENAEDGIKLRSYCQKHSVNTKKDKSGNSGSEEDLEKKKMKAMTAEERNQARAEKLQQIESEFYKYVRVKDVAQNLAVDMDIVMLVYNYWKLKRKSLNNRPLVPPRPETTQLLTQQQEQDLEQMKMFVQLRQDLERVRNLCYMVSRREKLSRTYFRLREQTFQKQVAILGEKTIDSLNPEERNAVLDANHGPSIYDQIYAHDKTINALKDYDTLVSLIAGEERNDKLVNGVIKSKRSSGSGVGGSNTFKKQFVNGARKKNLMGECSSISESEASASDAISTALRIKHSSSGRKPLSYLFDSDSSASKEIPGKGKKPRKGTSPGLRRGKKVGKSSTSDSDELELPVAKTIGNHLGKQEKPIYSDSDSEESTTKRRHGSPVATKASVKEFTRKTKSNKKDAQQQGATTSVATKPVPKAKGPGRKKKGFEQTDLIVPQREAAKKASESIRTVKQRNDVSEPSVASPIPVKLSDRESESFEKTAFEKFKDIAAASVQDKQKGVKRNDTNKSKAAENKKGTKKTAKVESSVPKEESENIGLSDEHRDQYDFDESNDSKNVPNFVPQRQAAKKAAVNIRSGLSNIVAARLIIEDEMEAASQPKKRKGDKTAPLKKSLASSSTLPSANNIASKKPIAKSRGKSPFPNGEESLPQAMVSNTKARKRTVSKEDTKGAGRGGKKDPTIAGAAEISTSDRQTDWPFLDRGTNAVCRRSRERSSSSSSSSSSGSSSSDSSSSSRSSASSSPASASPESITTPRKTSAAANKSCSASCPPTSSAFRGPSRKLRPGTNKETSDRSPDGRPRSEIITGKKPAPKSRRPGPLRSGRNSISSTHAPNSPQSQPFVDKSQTIRASSRSSSSDRGSPTPTGRRVSKDNKLAQEKGKRGKREPTRSEETEKGVTSSPSKTSSPLSSKQNAKSETGTETKALVGSSKTTGRGILDLSSDSDTETFKKSPDKINSQQITPIDSRNLRAAARAKKKGISNLSDSDSELAEEKENSCRAPEIPANESPSTNNSRNKVSKPGMTSSLTSALLSPLTPSSENKEKEQSLSRSSDAEPDTKRARLDSGASEQTQTSTGPGSGGNPLFSATAGGILSAKSLFSPRASHESDLVDFDSELYDLARSVSADYSQVDEEGGAAASSLPFFSQNFLSREDAVEDSPQATLNLVEKLRIQHARKSGCPRSSLDGSDLSLPDEAQKSPAVVSGRFSHERMSDSANIISSVDEIRVESANSKEDGVVPSNSPERDKLGESWLASNNRIEQSTLENHRVMMSESNSTNKMQPPNKPFSTQTSDVVNDVGHRLRQRSVEEKHQFSGHRTQDEASRSKIHKPNIFEIDKLGDNLSVSLNSPTIQQTISPGATTTTTTTSPSGVKLVHGVQSMLYPQVSSATSGFSGHAQFIYPIPGAIPSSIQNVNSPLTVSIGRNSPRSSFFQRNQSPQIPNVQHPPTSSLSPSYPRQNFPGSQHFLHGKPSGKEITTTTTSTGPSALSPTIMNQRRTSTPFLDDNAISDSIASVTSGMLPLAKPSIASPSMILAANNVKNVTPSAPPQSTVAQIIENVVNNHANASNSTLAAQELLNVMLGLSSQSMSLDMDILKMKPVSSCLPSSTMVTDDLNKPSLTGHNSTSELEKTNSKSGKKSNLNANISELNFEIAHKSVAETSSSKSPRGRGRRAATPRAAAAKAEKILTNCETNGIKPRGRGERKSTANTSPARAKPATPGRGRGRGKGRGKGTVATRKDLAGTVYDIDFDEFEENVDEKMDLRMLRERRKSSDIHGDNKNKSEHSCSPSFQLRGSLEISSPKSREERTVPNQKVLHQSQTLITNENIVPVPQSNPPGPMDMRTYNTGSGNLLEISEENRGGKADHSRRDINRVTDSTSIFSSGSDKMSFINELNDLDDTLEAFTSSSKANQWTSKGSNLHVSYVSEDPTIRLLAGSASEIQSSGMASRESSMDTIVDADLKSTNDFSRNQLKVKIKGPFLDANYGSNSIGDSSGVPHYSNSFHHPVGPSQIVNIPASNTSNLRRMRKKELLRQYWNQDMNMDGSSCGPTHDAEMSHSSMVHRSIITIPKAVASMANIPTKDDYRESMPSDDPLSFNTMGLLDSGSKFGATEKRKRNRGTREMAALGIITCDTPRERRRDRADPNTSNFSTEVMGKKRGKANKRPIRSTFIPPTLVDSDHSTNDKKMGCFMVPVPNISTVVTAVNHPTPKLKIKFGDLSKGPTTAILLATTISNHLPSDSSDKDTPSKKAKGKPPKKRGICEPASAAPPSMEELKRESMKFREMVMQEFAVEDRKQILQLQGTRRHKKHKRKGGGDGATNSETDDPSNPASAVKVITGGSTKLILRFGKRRESAGGDDSDIKPKEIVEGPSDKEMDDVGENDSGFTGGSEGSSGSVLEIATTSGGATKEIPSEIQPPLVKPERNPPSTVNNTFESVPALNNVVVAMSEIPAVASFSEISKELEIKPLIPESVNFPKNPTDKIMPIRLKLSRCFEGYALNTKPENCSGDPTPPAKQSDSCEVR